MTSQLAYSKPGVSSSNWLGGRIWLEKKISQDALKKVKKKYLLIIKKHEWIEKIDKMSLKNLKS